MLVQINIKKYSKLSAKWYEIIIREKICGFRIFSVRLNLIKCQVSHVLSIWDQKSILLKSSFTYVENRRSMERLGVSRTNAGDFD